MSFVAKKTKRPKKDSCGFFTTSHLTSNIIFFLYQQYRTLKTQIRYFHRSGRIYFGGPWESDIVIINAHDP